MFNNLLLVISLCLNIARKDKPFGQIFAFGFSWPEAFDATAEVYNGVSMTYDFKFSVLTYSIVCLLVNAYLPGAYGVV